MCALLFKFWQINIDTIETTSSENEVFGPFSNRKLDSGKLGDFEDEEIKSIYSEEIHLGGPKQYIKDTFIPI